MNRKLTVLILLLLTALASFSQTISIPEAQAKEITKGLINEEKLKKENAILLLEIQNFRDIKIRKEAVIFNLKEQIKITNEQLENLNKMLKLEIEKYKLLNSRSTIKSLFYGSLGVATGLVVGLTTK